MSPVISLLKRTTMNIANTIFNLYSLSEYLKDSVRGVNPEYGHFPFDPRALVDQLSSFHCFERSLTSHEPPIPDVLEALANYLYETDGRFLGTELLLTHGVLSQRAAKLLPVPFFFEEETYTKNIFHSYRLTEHELTPNVAFVEMNYRYRTHSPADIDTEYTENVATAFVVAVSKEDESKPLLVTEQYIPDGMEFQQPEN